MNEYKWMSEWMNDCMVYLIIGILIHYRIILTLTALSGDLKGGQIWTRVYADLSRKNARVWTACLLGRLYFSAILQVRQFASD